MSKHKDADTNADAGTDAETNEYGHELDRTVWRKGNDNGKNVSVYHTREDCQYLKTNAAQRFRANSELCPHIDRVKAAQEILTELDRQSSKDLGI
ncbi:hypothetical protein OSG_eHP40_00175 [environmental Halophage eHP-40]|nr:hypothetical protein OSG_eHP40_00175 [environmental Halophage eHP-40]